MARESGRRERFGVFRPTEAEVEDLIRRAEAHPGGVEFLMHGAQESVAAAFEVHAFVVDAARQQLVVGVKVR
jgi:hypothetical protein